MGTKSMELTVAETIKRITKNHILKNNGYVVGQCLTAVGWVQNTLPRLKKNIIELPMTDTAGSGIGVGMAIAGSRPILVLRFQSFLWLNSSPLVMHAAKSLELFNYSCPIFIRAIASEGHGSGPLHTNCYHSPFAHMPGLPICAPMTPREYELIWKKYRKDKKPLLVSEHRRSYKSSKEFQDTIFNKSKITIFAISATRFNVEDAKLKLQNENIMCDIFHIYWLKPFKIKEKYLNSLNKTGLGLILDSSYETCSISESIAHKLMLKSNKKVYIKGMKDYSPGVGVKLNNMTPTGKQIYNEVKKLIKKK